MLVLNHSPKKTINGVSITNNTSGFSLSGGSSNAKTFTLTDNASLSGSNTGDQTINLTGDVTGNGSGTFSTTLTTTGVVANTYGSSNKIPSIVVDAKGRITSANEVSLSNLALSSLSLSNGNVIVGDINNLASSVAMTGDVTISNGGITSIGNNKITNAMLLGSISSNKLVGTDINSVGTITSGTWNANTLSGQYGGTGINNGSKTITLGGNLTTAGIVSLVGNYTSTLTMTGNTNITLPTSGTLATLTGTETLSNKTLSSPILITPNLGVATATSISSGTISSTSDVIAKRFVLTNNTVTSSATTTIDLSAGNVITINMSGNITTLNITGAMVGTYLIKFVQDATGNRTISFPAAWKWAGGITPLLTTTANKLDIVTLIYDGSNYYSTIVQNF